MSFSTSIDRRDFFAAAALIGLLADQTTHAASVTNDKLAKWSFDLADAMIQYSWQNAHPSTKHPQPSTA
jgi:hypothetical protein